MEQDGFQIAGLWHDESLAHLRSAACGARRAVVVGDPLQIEPVFTVPQALIRAMSAQSPHTAGEAYARGASPCAAGAESADGVRNALKKRILELDWPGKRPRPIAVRNWCKTRVGTVHTFQGKEEAVVLMVLGVDTEHAGSATWAASKPNLLNVALTRAQRYFYAVGAAEVWAGQLYFGAVHAALPALSPAAFLLRLGSCPIVGSDPEG